jgi:hypothetical protein
MSFDSQDPKKYNNAEGIQQQLAWPGTPGGRKESGVQQESTEPLVGCACAFVTPADNTIFVSLRYG